MEIQGYPNYLIYEDGRVYSQNKKDFMTHVISKGYLSISLSKNGKKKFLKISRLIALHYIPNPDNKPEVDHIDRNKLNNSISNLRWATRQEQIDNRNVISNTGEKYIYKVYIKNRWQIEKRNCFREYLNCSHYTLEDAIMLRDSLLSMEDNVI